jgi:hypothetical protein
VGAATSQHSKAPNTQKLNVPANQVFVVLYKYALTWTAACPAFDIETSSELVGAAVTGLPNASFNVKAPVYAPRPLYCLFIVYPLDPV